MIPPQEDHADELDVSHHIDGRRPVPFNADLSVYSLGSVQGSVASCRQGCSSRDTQRGVVVGKPGPQCRLERLLPGRRPVRDTERRHLTTAGRCSGKRVAALGEQRPHLLAGHHIPDVEAVDAGQPAADPPTRRLTTLRVVAGQIRPPRCVASSAATWRIR
jgi:hypothetical protein